MHTFPLAMHFMRQCTLEYGSEIGSSKQHDKNEAGNAFRLRITTTAKIVYKCCRFEYNKPMKIAIFSVLMLDWCVCAASRFLFFRLFSFHSFYGSLEFIFSLQ